MIRAALVFVVAFAACNRDHERTSIGAAAVLRHAMPELVTAFSRHAGVEVEVTYGASDELAEQLSRGAAFDGVIFAEHGAIDGLAAAARVVPDSRRVLAATTIVLVGPASSTARFATLTSIPADQKIAIGDPETVPVGRYARTYLASIGAWDDVQPRLVLGGDAAGVLAYAVRGAARVAIVYRTDAVRAEPLAILDEPADAPAVTIVGGVASGARHATSARRFLAFVASREGQAILAKHGFSAAKPP